MSNQQQQWPFITSTPTPARYANSGQQQNPYPAIRLAPYTFQNPGPSIVQGRYQAQVQTQQDYRTPFTYRHTENRQTIVQITAQQPTLYQTQQPIIYQGRQPTPAIRQNPVIYQNPIIVQSPAIVQTPQRNSVQQRNSFQQSYRTQTPYTFRQPSIVQQTNTGTRPIQQVAKVKAVYVKTAVGVQKLDEIFVKKDSSTVEKIHQSVPTAQLNK